MKKCPSLFLQQEQCNSETLFLATHPSLNITAKFDFPNIKIENIMQKTRNHISFLKMTTKQGK